jgi:hypothetical protein
MSMLYWQIGKKINDAIAGQNRSDIYGKQIVSKMWRQLATDYGTAFSEKNLRRMMQFAEVFPDEKIVVSVIRQLSWNHIITNGDFPQRLKFNVEFVYLKITIKNINETKCIILNR